MAYRVARNKCIVDRQEYLIGETLPDLPVADLNVHLPNLEIIDEPIAPKPPKAPPKPPIKTATDDNKSVAVIKQVEQEGGTDYGVSV